MSITAGVGRMWSGLFSTFIEWASTLRLTEKRLKKKIKMVAKYVQKWQAA